MSKILIINTTFDKGGAARVARDLFANSKSSLDVFFAYGRGRRVTDARTYKFGNIWETVIHILLVRFLGLEGHGSYFSTRKLIRFIKKEKFDLVHLHNLHGYYLNFSRLIKFIQNQKIPVIWTLHDEWPITWLPAHSLGCNHCKTGVGKCTNSYAYPKNYFPLFSRYMLNRKKTVFSGGWNPLIICPSEWLKNNIANSFLGKFRIKVVYNGIDTELFHPMNDKNALKQKYNLPPDKKIIIFLASNLSDRSKGIGTIITVAKILQDKPYLFMGIGRGKTELLDNLITPGYIYDQAKLAEMYALSDLFCFASTAETFSLTAAEALACGLPVVGFDIPVIREIFKENIGTLVKSGDDKALAAAIDKLMSDKETRITMGNNGRKFIAANYSQELFYINYNNLYNELLK